MANLAGFASTLHFAIPDSPTLRALAASIDDCLLKIRHSQDINSITRILPLFESPIVLKFSAMSLAADIVDFMNNNLIELLNNYIQERHSIGIYARSSRGWKLLETTLNL
jgi:hypothetical protein